MTNSINEITYRQFNYQRLMKCSTQIARWLINQLVLKYTQASLQNSFTMLFSTIKRDSGLLNGYSRTRDAIATVDGAWKEIKDLGVLQQINKSDRRGPRGKLIDIMYTLYPSPKFSVEQKAANRRQSDAKATVASPLIEQTKDIHDKELLVDRPKKSS